MESSEYLIVGLGNPGPEYEQTRHNYGFMALESFAKSQGISGKKDSKMNALIGRGTVKIKRKTEKVILAQPLTYMNLSGESVQKILHYYKIPITNLLVMYDDTAIPWGRLRFRPDGSAGSHNGMKSLIECLGTQVFPRLRLGVGMPPANWQLKDFVLAKFSAEEQAQLPEALDTIKKAITTWLDTDTQTAMNRFNAKELFSQPEDLPKTD